MALTFAIPDSVLSTTLANYRTTLEDNIFKSDPVYAKLKEQGSIRKIGGGESIVIPLMYGKNSTIAGYSGYGIIDTTPQDGITSAKFSWKQVAGSITISGKEARQNSSKEQLINLLKSKVNQAELSFKDYFAQKLFGTAPSDTGTDPHSLATLCATTGTVGGIAKGSYSWWQSQSGTAASFAANGLAEMRNIYNDCSQQSATDAPNLIITTQEAFEAYEGLLQPQERLNSTAMADGGFKALLFKGVPIVWAPYTTGHGAIAASKMYFLNTKYLELVVHSDADMKTTEFVEPENQDAKVAKMIWMGELTISNAQKQGILSITAA